MTGDARSWGVWWVGVWSRIVDYERVRADEPWFAEGWSPLLFGLDQDQCDKLVTDKVLRLVPNTRGRVRYLLVDREGPSGVGSGVGVVGPKQSSQLVGEVPVVEEKRVDAPDFGDIVGYEDVKKLISESLRVGARVHYLLLGPTGSAKTLFLLAIEELLGSSYVLGSRMSRSGLAGFLMDEQPRFLLIDEIDKLPSRDLAPLLSLCETGRVVEVLNRKRREEVMDTVVFGACNAVKRMPPELLSRFQVLKFKPYTKKEFVGVCERVLVRREGLTLLEARQVAVRVMDDLKSKDIRAAIRVARLAGTSLGIDGVVEIFKNYRSEH